VAAKADEKCSGISEWLWQIVSVCVGCRASIRAKQG
jgi:hypothetical protein